MYMTLPTLTEWGVEHFVSKINLHVDKQPTEVQGIWVAQCVENQAGVNEILGLNYV